MSIVVFAVSGIDIAGSITSSGSINIGGTAIVVGTGARVGSVTNSGSISPGGGHDGLGGISISEDRHGQRDQRWNDHRTAGRDHVNGTVSGAVVNTSTGVINGEVSGVASNAGSVGIEVANTNASVPGGIINAGTISAGVGIEVQGGATLAGPITNTGNITSPSNGAAIFLEQSFNGTFTTLGAGNAITINQNGGTITGAIDLSGNGDTLASPLEPSSARSTVIPGAA